jgi:hypothetical protein
MRRRRIIGIPNLETAVLPATSVTKKGWVFLRQKRQKWYCFSFLPLCVYFYISAVRTLWNPVYCKAYLLSVIVIRCTKRLRWSRGSVLAFRTQVQRFKPDRSRPIFQGEKFLSTPSFGREVKLWVPCCRFTACEIPECYMEVGHLQAKFTGHFSPT